MGGFGIISILKVKFIYQIKTIISMKTKVLIENIFASEGHGSIIRGKVTDGTLTIGMKYKINGKNIIIKSLEMGHAQTKRVKTDEKFQAIISGGDYELLKPVLKTEVEFFDEGYSIEKDLNAEEKKGVFNSVKSIFKK